MSAQALWCEVLLQALTDGLNCQPVSDPFRWDDGGMHPQDYVLVPNPDFELVCYLAGVEVEAVRRAFRARLARKVPGGPHDPWGNRKASTKPAPKPVTTYTYQGRSLTLREWAAVSKLSRELLMERVNQRGWPIERALTEPVGRRMPKPSRADRAQVERISSELAERQTSLDVRTAG